MGIRAAGFASIGLVLLAGACAGSSGPDGGAAVERVIFDTDVGGDIDDAGALAVLHALEARGEIELLAIGVSIGHEAAVPYVHAVNTWYGRPELPIGTIKGEASYARDEFMEAVIAEYPYDLTRESTPEVVDLYRRVLATQPDNSVTLVTVGPATNIVALLRSGPDEHSELNGIDLVRRKVKFYGAGGNGRAGLPDGRCGFNCFTDLEAARDELELMPTEVPMVYAGGSGTRLELGSVLASARPDHIIRRSYEAYYDGVPSDRFSWDQLRVLYATRPALRTLWETSPRGSIAIAMDSTITWSLTPDENRAYAYVSDFPAVRAALEELMLHDPRDGATGEDRSVQPR